MQMRLVIMDLTRGRTGNPQNKDRLKMNKKIVSAEIDCVKEDDFERSYEINSHLGGTKLKVGDAALGYDIGDCNMSGHHSRLLRKTHVPTAILVKKVFHTK